MQASQRKYNSHDMDYSNAQREYDFDEDNEENQRSHHDRNMKKRLADIDKKFKEQKYFREDPQRKFVIN